jgi:hypothetical protein
VADGHGGAAEVTSQVLVRADAAQAPTARIASPTTTTTWAVGDRITLQAGAPDPGDAPSSYRWDLAVIHCSASPPFDCHTHPLQTIDGPTGSFYAPDHDYPSRLSVTLTVTDPDGEAGSTTVELLPRTATITVDTVPDGLRAYLGGVSVPEGQPQTVIAGSTQSFSVPAPQVLGGYTYRFVGWSDGAASTARTATMSVDRRFVAHFNGRPVATVTARPVRGTRPVRVRLSAARSVDPEGLPLTYGWDLDRDGRFDDARGVRITRVFTSRSPRRVAVRVVDSLGAGSIASVAVRPRHRT